MGKSNHKDHEKKVKKLKKKSRAKKSKEHHDWHYIETLNKGLGVSKKNSYVDTNGYLRWRQNDRLVHRELAKQCIYKKGSFALPFSRYEVHHKNRNELDNNLNNLEILTPEEHALRHARMKLDRKQKKHDKKKEKKSTPEIHLKFVRIARANYKRKETHDSIYIDGKFKGWYPLKHLIVREGYIYAPEKLVNRKV